MAEDVKDRKPRCIEIVLATDRDEDRKVLAEMLAGSIWKLIEANTWSAGKGAQGAKGSGPLTPRELG